MRCIECLEKSHDKSRCRYARYVGNVEGGFWFPDPVCIKDMQAGPAEKIFPNRTTVKGDIIEGAITWYCIWRERVSGYLRDA